MKHLRLTRDLAAALAERAEELGLPQQEVLRRVFRRALDGELQPATYVPGSTYGVAPLALHPASEALADELTREARNPGYELRRWLAAGLGELTGRRPAPGRGTRQAPRTPRTMQASPDPTVGVGGAANAAGSATPACGPSRRQEGAYSRTPAVGLRVDAAVRRGERRARALAEVAGAVGAGLAVLAVFGACTLLGLAGAVMTLGR